MKILRFCLQQRPTDLSIQVSQNGVKRFSHVCIVVYDTYKNKIYYSVFSATAMITYNKKRFRGISADFCGISENLHVFNRIFRKNLRIFLGKRSGTRLTGLSRADINIVPMNDYFRQVFQVRRHTSLVHVKHELPLTVVITTESKMLY